MLIGDLEDRFYLFSDRLDTNAEHRLMACDRLCHKIILRWRCHLSILPETHTQLSGMSKGSVPVDDLCGTPSGLSRDGPALTSFTPDRVCLRIAQLELFLEE